MLKSGRDKSLSCLSEEEGLVSGNVDNVDIWFWYKLDPHEAVNISSFSGSSDNEGIPCSDFPCNTQPGGKFLFVSLFSPSSIMKDCSNNCQHIFQNHNFFHIILSLRYHWSLIPQIHIWHRTLSAYTLLYKYLFLFPSFCDGIAFYFFQISTSGRMFLGHICDFL